MHRLFTVFSFLSVENMEPGRGGARAATQATLRRWYVSGAAPPVARPASPLPSAATSAGHYVAAVTTRLHIKRCACCSTRHRQRHPESPRAASAPSGSGRFTAPIAGWTPPRLASSSPRRSSLASVSGTPSAWTPRPRPRSFRSCAWTWRPQAAPQKPRLTPCGHPQLGEVRALTKFSHSIFTAGGKLDDLQAEADHQQALVIQYTKHK